MMETLMTITMGLLIIMLFIMVVFVLFAMLFLIFKLAMWAWDDYKRKKQRKLWQQRMR
jgi:uncharacterized membrane protein